MREPYTTASTQVNKSELPNNNLSVGTVIRFIRTWREDAPVDRVLSVVSRPASVERALAA